MKVPTALSIVSVAPRKGPTVGGATVTVTVEGATSQCSLVWGGQPVTDVQWEGDCVAFRLPPHGVGSVDLVVLDGEKAQAVQSNAFLYELTAPPRVNTVAPRRGPASGGTEVELRGGPFAPRTSVLVSGTRPRSVAWIDESCVEIMMPPARRGAVVSFELTNPDGQQVIVQRAFQYDD